MKYFDVPSPRRLLNLFIPLAVSALLLSQASLASAKTLYVADELVITFREGKGTQYRIIKTLKTSTPVEVLEEGKEYFKVRIKSGEEGYVLKQYLNDETPKPQVIAALRKEIKQLKSQLAAAGSGRTEISAQLAESQKQQEQLNSKLEKTTAALQKLQVRYDDLSQKSENVVALSDERDRLASENSQLSAELKVLREENRTLLRTAMIQWFLAGAGVFLGGWVSGKFSRKKRRNGFS